MRGNTRSQEAAISCKKRFFRFHTVLMSSRYYSWQFSLPASTTVECSVNEVKRPALLAWSAKRNVHRVSRPEKIGVPHEECSRRRRRSRTQRGAGSRIQQGGLD